MRWNPFKRRPKLITLRIDDQPITARIQHGGVLPAGPTPLMVAEYPGASTYPEIVVPRSLMADTFREVMGAFNGGEQPIDPE